METTQRKVRKSDLEKALKRVTGQVHRTPVLTSTQLNERSGADLYFKCENFQRMGAFKMRGAVNAIRSLSEEQRRLGVVTHSSGNFAQALSLAAKQLGTRAFIVMPNTAPAIKKEAVASYGGEILECEPTLEAREQASDKLRELTGATFIHPSNDMDVILGNATAGMELIEEVPELEMLISPVGGGGLLAGTALAANFFEKDCKVYGAEPFEADDAYRSFHSGQIQENERTETIADGLRTQLGDVNFPLIRAHVQDIIRVAEGEIIAAMRLIWERMKIVVEPSAAVTLAAVLAQPELVAGKKIGIIISGGNVDLGKLPF